MPRAGPGCPPPQRTRFVRAGLAVLVGAVVAVTVATDGAGSASRSLSAAGVAPGVARAAVPEAAVTPRSVSGGRPPGPQRPPRTAPARVAVPNAPPTPQPRPRDAAADPLPTASAALPTGGLGSGLLALTAALVAVCVRHRKGPGRTPRAMAMSAAMAVRPACARWGAERPASGPWLCLGNARSAPQSRGPSAAGRPPTALPAQRVPEPSAAAPRPPPAPGRQPKTSTGLHLRRVLRTAPDEFVGAVRGRVRRLCDRVEATRRQQQWARASGGLGPPTAGAAGVDGGAADLFSLQPLTDAQRSGAVQDVLYYGVMRRYGETGTAPFHAGQLDGVADCARASPYRPLRAVYGEEALAEVERHVACVFGKWEGAVRDVHGWTWGWTTPSPGPPGIRTCFVQSESAFPPGEAPDGGRSRAPGLPEVQRGCLRGIPLVLQQDAAEEEDFFRSHAGLVVGPVDDDPGAPVNIPKFHVLEVFAASLLFGCFLRRVHERHQHRPDCTFWELEHHRKVFAADPARRAGGDLTFRAYLDDMCANGDVARQMRVLSREAEQVAREHASALFGGARALYEQFEEETRLDFAPSRDLWGAGDDAEARAVREEEQWNVREAVVAGDVETLVMGVADLRSLVLDAVTFGTFLSDAERDVERQADCPLLTPSDPPPDLRQPKRVGVRVV